MMIQLAALFATMAALSGIFAVGSGRHWHFKVTDYFRGKRNAILYLWVIVSTIYSIIHSGALIEYGLENNWTPWTAKTNIFMFFHAGMGVLLTMAHAYVAYSLNYNTQYGSEYLWGKRAR